MSRLVKIRKLTRHWPWWVPMLIAIAVIGGLLVTTYYVTGARDFINGFHAMDESFDKEIQAKDRAEKAVKSLKLTSEWEFRNEQPYGDPLDSPDNVGYEFNYRSNERAAVLIPKIADAVKQAGFTVTEIDSPQKDSTERGGSLKAKRASDDIQLSVVIADDGTASFINIDSNAVRRSEGGGN